MAFGFLLLLSLPCFVAAAATTSHPSSRKPPLGWSSWYALGGQVNQTAMEQTFRKLTNRSVVPGDSRSLLDVGYTFANMDDGYQACGAGVNGSYHDAKGYPILDPDKFTNVTVMTSLARTLGLKPGFYVNNYICGSGECAGGVGGGQYERVMHSTVSFLKENGYQYLKVDSGGCYNDMSLWKNLLDAAEWPMTVENCHQGGQPPNATWCPFDLWRVGADVNGEGPDVEILQVIAALSSAGPGARSGCRPYPDFMSLPGFKNSPTVRSNFGLYAIMGTPMVFSFDVRDDTKLLPLWDVLTNEEVLAVNQDVTAAAGTLLRMINPQPATAAQYAWAVPCNAKDPLQHGWSYDAKSHRVQWQAGSGNDDAAAAATPAPAPASASAVCLSVPHLGAPLLLANCSSSDSTQAWVLSKGRLWQGVPKKRVRQTREKERERALPPVAGAVGSIHLSACAAASAKPGQQWTFSDGGVTTNVQLNLTTRMGGCWEITGCSFGQNADVGTTYGCKGIPKPGAAGGPCDVNGAWSFNQANGTITSVMSGHCLEASGSDGSVGVSLCTGKPNQQWKWATHATTSSNGAGGSRQPIESVAFSGQCVDDGDVPAPAGTDGNCAALTHVWTNLAGPGISLQNPASNGSPCQASDTPAPNEAFNLGANGALEVGGGTQCVAAIRGQPSPFGPIQLWAKPLVGGSVAVLFAHRGGSDEPAYTTMVQLSELPGIGSAGSVEYIVRDVWSHADVPGAIVNGAINFTAAGQGSVFYVLRKKT